MQFLKLFFLIALILLVKSGPYLPSFVPICTGLSTNDCNGWDGCSNQTCMGSFNISLFNCSSYWDIGSCQRMGCTWNGCTGISKGLSCSLYYSDMISCATASIRNCSWNTTLNSCVGTFNAYCADLNTSNYCNLGSGCYWMNGECVGNFLGYKTCDKLGYPYCSVAPGCKPDCSATPQILCPAITNELMCGAYTGCYWKYGLCNGNFAVGSVVPCTNFPVNTCNQIPGCSLGTSCSNFPCNATKSMEICMNTQGCWWHRGTCVWKFEGIII